MLLVFAPAGCWGTALPGPDGATVIRCPLSTELTYRWLGRVQFEETHHLVPPGLYRRARQDAPLCQRALPDCDDDETTVDLGDVNRALQHPEVDASWPGSGQRVYTWDPQLTDIPSFEIEAKGRGSLLMSPSCDVSGCVLPPASFLALRHALLGVAQRVEDSCP